MENMTEVDTEGEVNEKDVNDEYDEDKKKYTEVLKINEDYDNVNEQGRVLMDEDIVTPSKSDLTKVSVQKMDTQLKEMKAENSSEPKHIPVMLPSSYSGPLPQSYPGPPPPSYPGGTDVINTQPNSQPIIMANFLGYDPVVMTCSFCNQQIVTRIERVVWFRTHLMAGLLCLVGCWPCVAIPYCTDVFKKAVHYCPNCNAYIGTQP